MIKHRVSPDSLLFIRLIQTKVPMKAEIVSSDFNLANGGYSVEITKHLSVTTYLKRIFSCNLETGCKCFKNCKNNNLYFEFNRASFEFFWKIQLLNLKNRI